MSERTVDRTVPPLGGKGYWDEILYVRKWLQSTGVSFDYFERQKMELTEQLGQAPTPADVLWTILQRWVEGSRATGDLETLENAYHQMATFLYGEGRDFFAALGESHRAGLMVAREQGFREVEIRARRRLDIDTKTFVNVACAVCVEWQGRVLTIDDALEQMPLPNRQCTHEEIVGAPGWCQCLYLPR